MKNCPVCKKVLKGTQIFFCSNLCQSNDRYKKYIESWKVGSKSGSRGINTKNFSAHVKKYLFEKYGNKCSICSWSVKHPISKIVPLEIDHIYGNSDDNREVNLRIICPNCHSLSSNYKNLNNGMGRSWRRNKYIKNLKGTF